MNILTGLGLSGNILKNKREKKKKNKVNFKRNIVDNYRDNIYSSNGIKRSKRILNEKTSSILNHIKNKGSERILERFSDTDSIFSEDASLDNISVVSNISDNRDLTDHTRIFEKSQMLTDNKLYEKKINNNRSNYLTQFDSVKFDNKNNPVSFNDADSKTCNEGYNKRLSEEQQYKEGFSVFNPAEDNNMSYNISDDLSHNNMMPFYSERKGYGGLNSSNIQRNKYNQRKMELFTGNLNEADYQSRKEKAPLFAPDENIQNIHGMSGITDALDGRFIPSRFRRNENPFEEEKITPGLGIGPYGKSTGIHDTYRPTFKTIDELRTVDNKQITYSGRVVKGIKKSELRRGLKPNKVYKRRPERFTVGRKPVNKKFTGPSASKIRSKVNDKLTNRAILKKEMIGPAYDKSKSNKVRPKINRSGKISYLPDRAGMISGTKRSTGNRNSYYLKTTLKDTTAKNNRVGNVSGKDGSYVYDKENFTPDTTLKDLTVINKRVGLITGNEEGKVHDANTYRPRNTLKEGFVDNNRLGNINSSVEAGKAYDDDTYVPKITMKQGTEENKRMGNISGNDVGKAYDDETYVPRITLKQGTEDTIRLGNLGNMIEMGKAYDENTYVPKITLKQGTEDTTRIGNLGNMIEMGKAYDENTYVPKITLRQGTEDKVRLGNLASLINMGKAYDENTYVPKVTLRQGTEKNDRLGNLGHLINMGKAYDENTYTPKTTLRQGTEKTARLGNFASLVEMGQAYNDNTYTPRTTLRQSTEKSKSAGYIKGPTLGNAYNKEMFIPKTTLRQGTTDTKHQRPISLNKLGSYGAHHQNTNAKTTIKETTVKNKHQGQIFTNKGLSYVLVGENIYAVPTMRQGYSETKHQKPIFIGKIGSYHAAQKGTYAPITIKQMTIDNKHLGALSGRKKEVNREASYNARMNTIREKLLVGRTPTTSNYNVGPTNIYTKTRFAEPIQINRELFGSRPGLNPGRLIPLVRKSNTLPHNKDRLTNHHTEDILKNNPYINNTQHKALRVLKK
jgi:hypothetical protein